LILAAALVLGACAKATPTPTPTPAATTKATPTPTPAATTKAATVTPQYGGVLRVNLNSQVSVFGWPVEARGAADGSIGNLYFESLLLVDTLGNLTPCLATEWKFAPDYKSITFTLRKGVKFHDGTDWNAEAAKFGLDAYIAAKKSIAAPWDSVEVIDDYTVRINLKYFQNTIPTDFSNPKFASPTAFKTKGIDWVRLNPVGTGPFKFVSQESTVNFKVKRNDDYWQKGKPYLDGVEYFFILDAVTASLALQAGKMDVIINVSAKQAGDLQALGFQINNAVAGTATLFPDSAKPGSPFADKRVRQALSFAIDREAIVKALGYGIWVPTYQLMNPDNMAYIPDLKNLCEHNPDKARQLLADAGYPKGFKFTLMPSPLFGQDVMAAVQSQLAEVGIDAQLEFLQYATFTEYHLKGWSGLLCQPCAGFNPNFAASFRMYAIDDFVSLMKPAGFLDLLDDALKKATDPGTQKALNQKLNRMIFDEAMVIPLWFNGDTFALSKNVHDAGFNYSTSWVPWLPADAWLSK
jgi:peptide/nickel transport system substrate-binding protein